MLQKLPDINNKSSQLKDALLAFQSSYIEDHGSFESFQAKRTVQNFEDSMKAVATVKVTQAFLCNSVLVNEVIPEPIQMLKASSDSEMPGTSTGDVGSEEKVTKKVARNTSNGSKRKVRLRRMGSRQSSKTESDTDDEQAVNSDVSRKVKRKTSRAKKQLESDKSFESFQAEDEVVYVFKIKPGEKNEVTVKPLDSPKTSFEECVLISPTENSVHIIDPSNENNHNESVYSNAIVKTKRKIFTPIDTDDGTVNATISQEVESSSASDKNENDKTKHQTASSQMDHAKISTLPPLPSPKVQKKFELTKQNSGKDLSPSIRLMIDRYTSSIDKKSNSPNSSGSCSPIWRSPILDRRVRKQSQEYQHKLVQSNSSQDINEISNGTQSNEPEVVIEDTTSFDVPENQNNIETVAEPKKVHQNLGAIPKEPKMMETPEIEVPMLDFANDIVTMRVEKPRTPLSERALKIKLAKEAFLRMPLVSHESGHSDWSYRLSQISVGSTDSNTDTGSFTQRLVNAGIIEKAHDEQEDNTSAEVKSSSLPRSIKGLQSNNDSETTSETSKSSRFGLSSLATKLRKVKLKRSSKEVKNATVPVFEALVRQSLTVDFSPTNSSTGEASSRPSRFEKNKPDIKKSKSLGILDN